MHIIKRLEPYIQLCRLNKPIGVLLLLWPCFWFVLISSTDIRQLLYYLFISGVGALAVRSTGCVINDMFDLKYDRQVSRTATRPLASGKITYKQSFILLFCLASISVMILLSLKIQVQQMGLVVATMIVIYPLMKRFTYWPQLFLGIVFNSGVLMLSMEFHDRFTIDGVLLYIGCVFWTLGYDTIYALQDRKSDIIAGVKSTAIILYADIHSYLRRFYSIALFLWLIVALGHNMNLIFYLCYAVVAYYILCIYLRQVKIRVDEDSENFSDLFYINNYIGIAVFVCFLLGIISYT